MIFLTTTRLSDKIGINSRQLFSQLNESGWIERNEDNRWVLTEKGKAMGGQTRSTPETGEFVVWPEEIKIDGIEKVQEDKTPALSPTYNDSDVSDDSEGEDYIAEYFDAIEMEFREQHVIEGLDDKYASYRIADFYLPKYKVIVEFAGMWNRSEQERTRYRHKKEVYKANGIPCIWIYPDNLGVLHYIFHKRLETVLGNHSLEKGLLRYRLTQFWKEDSGNFVGIAFGLLLLFWGVTPWEENTGGVWISIAIVAYNLYRIITDLNSVLKGRSIEISRLNKWED
ncbi:MAG: hypothetical protein KDC93_11840 [Cyclobacteriaceae bacterium]|nr:hypothetical protein [Cyclobacteriaceae bacterium]